MWGSPTAYARLRRVAVVVTVLVALGVAIAVLPPDQLLVWLFLASVAGALLAVAVAVWHLVRGPH